MEQFERYRQYLNSISGIYVPNEKKNIFQMKLDKILRTFPDIAGYDMLFQLIRKDKTGEMKEVFLNVMTTNTTEFFREDEHFNYIKSNWTRFIRENPRIIENQEIRMWSAAASTGQEAITMAIVLQNLVPPNITIKILATDINTQVLSKAAQGIYHQEEVSSINKVFLLQYFDKIGGMYHLKEEIRRLITYRQLNLNERFPFKKQFDIIFCRNVMIYFPPDVRQNLIKRISDVLVPSGMLMIGHSEAIESKPYKLERMGPSIYKKSP